jgi:hypothetical protein
MNWQSYSQGIEDNRNFVGALTDVGDSDLINEIQGSKDIGDGPMLQDNTTS